MRIVNQTIPRALAPARLLGRGRATDVVEFIAEHNSVVDAPHLKEEHYPVFDTLHLACRPIHYMGHVRMMARGAAVHLGRHQARR